MFMESLTTGPELENSQGHSRRFRDVCNMSVPHPISDMGADIADRRFVPRTDIDFSSDAQTSEKTGF
jgi:hypothetical protein